MKKEDKTLMIDKIKETLDKYSVVYLANTTSLNAEKTVDLRRAAFKAGIKMMVVKNTLLKKANPRIQGCLCRGDRLCRRAEPRRSRGHQEQERTHRRCCGIAPVAGQECYQCSAVGW